MSKKSKANLAITLAIATMVLVFYSSSVSYQDQSLVAILQTIFKSQPFAQTLSKIQFYYGNKLISVPSLGYAQFIEFFIRKTCHVLIYYFMAYQWAKGLQFYMKYKWTSYVLAFFIIALYAMTDEFHQGLTPGRTPLMQDAILDSFGGLMGIIVVRFKK
ncbi:VanZ like family protein [Granulicatella balaenopterae]|uniref:VanZ like family protein n=1 Tax=Granulicatella balaenopterae TaxID=137733 RepID=A0A1H9H5W2_9LACT|nr:VanZ family protein [Granulicatella balaenopterae]SEQ57618.1 VanZ like family protein [Granulicatella balaenopterae]